MKRVRMLLRVSSNQQLEADGDLSLQRQIVKEYVEKHPDWELDSKEYFEGGVSGYKNSVSDRDALQEAYRDAERKEFDVLVTYKDDRVGRKLWEVCIYIMGLKSLGVDIYTVKDGLISPESNDVMGQVMLALRYGNAQKSSADTGMRVKDTAQKLVQQGKFMGGKAPFGYRLERSGEISKHGRALKHLVIVPEQAEVVKHIYDLSLHKEFGSAKIASTLNKDETYKKLAPNDFWKGGTITSILTNPIYAGHVAYKRRENINGRYRSLNSKDWILSYEANENITIIDSATWNKVQEKRMQRGDKFKKKPENNEVTVIKRNDGMLALVDIAHCGYCGCKLVNGSRYNYWEIKATGERRTSKIPIYKCQNAWQGVPHDKTKQFRADEIERIVFHSIADYISNLQNNESVFEDILKNQNKEMQKKEKGLEKERQELDKIRKKIKILEDKIPDAMIGEYRISLDDLMRLIEDQRENEQAQLKTVEYKEIELKESSISLKDWEDVRRQIPSWNEILINADTTDKRVLVNQLIERIDITKEEIIIRFKINLSDLFPQSRISNNGVVPE